MDLESLRSFYHVAKEGSFSRAAKVLHVSQPAMSVRIKTLETELGERLFDRARQGVALTEAGAILFESAEKIFGDVEEALTRLRELKEAGVGNVRLGCSDTASMNLLPGVLKKFRKRYPAAEITIRNAYSRGILDLLTRGELDFGIVSRPASMDRRLEASVLFDEPFVFVCQKNDPALRRSQISLDMLDGRPMVALEKGTHARELVDRALRQAGARPKIVLETGNIEVQKLYASAGFGFALVPESALLSNDRRRLQVRPLAGSPLERSIAVVVPRARYLSRAAAALIEMLRESVESA